MTTIRPISTDRILSSVSSYYRVSVTTIRSRNLCANVALARHVAIYLMRKYSGLSLKQIASAIGRKDHTTTLHASSRIAWEIDNNYQRREQIADIEKRMGLVGVRQIA